jgi:hypothetical protein
VVKPTTHRAPAPPSPTASDCPTEFNTFGARFPRGRRRYDSGDESWKEDE